MQDPAHAFREQLEEKSPEIAELIGKHKDNATLARIGDYINLVQDYAQVLEAQAGIYKAKHDHFHLEGNKVINPAEYNNKPFVDNRQQNIVNNEFYIPRENVIYKVSKRYLLNASQIGCVDVDSSRVLVAGYWLSLEPWECTRLTQLINSDNR